MRKNNLKEYLKVASVSLALIRAHECRYPPELATKTSMLYLGCGDGLFVSKDLSVFLSSAIPIAEEWAKNVYCKNSIFNSREEAHAIR